MGCQTETDINQFDWRFRATLYFHNVSTFLSLFEEIPHVLWKEPLNLLYTATAIYSPVSTQDLITFLFHCFICCTREQYLSTDSSSGSSLIRKSIWKDHCWAEVCELFKVFYGRDLFCCPTQKVATVISVHVWHEWCMGSVVLFLTLCFHNFGVPKEIWNIISETIPQMASSLQ